MAEAKSYQISQIRVEVEVQTDGTIAITEHRTYQFDGDYSWADYRLPLKGFTDIKNIRVSEQGKSFYNENSEEPGTFLVQKNSDRIRIKWFYDANDEQRTFTLKYDLEGALVIGPKWVEFFWNYLSSRRDKDTGAFQITWNLPEEVAKDSLQTWLRSTHNPVDLQTTKKGYILNAKNIDDDHAIKVRSVFPRRILHESRIETTDDSFSLAWVKQDEKNYREELARQKEIDAYNARIGNVLNILAIVLSIIIFTVIYRKYGKRHPVGKKLTREALEVPQNYHPSVAGLMLNGESVTSNMLMGNVMELARRGYFLIKEEETEKKFWSGKEKKYIIEKKDDQPEEKRTDWDDVLVAHINEKVKNSPKELNELFSDEIFKIWKGKLSDYGNQQNWNDTRSYKGAGINAFLQLIMVGLTCYAAYLAGPVAITGIIITLLFVVFSFAIVRRTEEGERIYQTLKIYKEMLTGEKDHQIEEDLLDRHVIFAVAFGISSKKIEQLLERPNVSEVILYWMVLTPGSTPADVASSFTTLSSSGSSAFPGTTGGVAGGATAGAAGGGAAGGAG